MDEKIKAEIEQEFSWNNRILVVDDNRDIHADYRKILESKKKNENELALDEFESSLFGEDEEFSKESVELPELEIESAYQGKQALEMQEKASEEGRPYALMFMDVRMPPGWDGVVTTERIWRNFPDTEIVIVSAYSDYSWNGMVQKLGLNDRLLFLKKPFDGTTVKQLAINLLNRWNNGYKARQYINRLESEISMRNEALEKAIRSM